MQLYCNLFVVRYLNTDKTFMDKIVTKKIDWIRRVVEITNDPEVKAALMTYGYNTVNIQNLNSMFTNVYNLIEKQRSERLNIHSINQQFLDKRNSINTVIKKDIRLCNIAFGKNKVLKRLIPDYYTVIPYKKWREISLMFYKGIKGESDAINILSAYKITNDIIDNRIADIEEVEKLNILRDKTKTNSKEATRKRNEALNNITDECRKVVGLARLVLGNDSSLLKRV